MVLNHPYSAVPRRKTAIRLVKSRHALSGAPVIRLLACGEGGGGSGELELLTQGSWAEESESEFFFHLDHPLYAASCPVRVELNWPGAELHTVLCEGRRIPLDGSGQRSSFTVDLGGLRGRTRTLDVHTRLLEPGLLTRIEQNAPHRRAGVFRTTPWPDTEIKATLHYLLAAREIARAMGWPQRLAPHQAGRVAIMGFETNNPPHPDYPPHWHLIAEWPHSVGSLASHLYLDPQGRIVRNRVTVNGTRAAAEYQRNEWCLLHDHTGADLLALAIGADGSLAITSPEQPIYTLACCAEQQACRVCDAGGRELGRLQVVNDPDTGSLTSVWRSSAPHAGEHTLPASFRETATYDPLTGHTLGVERHAIPQ